METAKPPLQRRATATAAAVFFFFIIRLLARACLSLGPDVSLSLSPSHILTPQSVLPCGLITARGWRAGTVLFSVISGDCLM